MLAEPTCALHAPRTGIGDPTVAAVGTNALLLQQAAEGVGFAAHAYVKQRPFQELVFLHRNNINNDYQN
jgi:hypothetical protein